MEAGGVLIDDQAGDALRLVLRSADHGHIDIVEAAAADELLGAVEDVSITVEAGGSLESRRVRPAARLRQRIAGDLVHAHEIGEVFRLHLRPAERVDHPGGHVVDRDIGAGRGAAVGHRLHDQRGLQAPEPDPAALLADVDRAEAQLGAGLNHVAREVVLLVPLGGEWGDGVGGETLRHLLDRALLFGELELTGHDVPIDASASISTFHSGRRALAIS